MMQAVPVDDASGRWPLPTKLHRQRENHRRAVHFGMANVEYDKEFCVAVLDYLEDE